MHLTLHLTIVIRSRNFYICLIMPLSTHKRRHPLSHLHIYVCTHMLYIYPNVYVIYIDFLLFIYYI